MVEKNVSERKISKFTGFVGNELYRRMEFPCRLNHIE